MKFIKSDSKDFYTVTKKKTLNFLFIKKSCITVSTKIYDYTIEKLF